MKFINKYWRVIILVIAFLLIGCIFLLIKSRGEVKEAKLIAETNKIYFDKELAKQKIEIEELKASNDSVIKEISKSKVVIIKEETKYETIKKSPIRTNYTSAELAEWVKSYESKASRIRK